MLLGKPCKKENQLFDFTVKFRKQTKGLVYPKRDYFKKLLFCVHHIFKFLLKYDSGKNQELFNSGKKLIDNWNINSPSLNKNNKRD